MLAAYGSDVYKIVLVLHILCAIVGFGAVMLNAIYGQQAKSHKGPEGLAIAQANFLVSRIGEYFIYAVFLLGVALVLMGDNNPGVDFAKTWIWLSMFLFIVALGISHGLLMPRVKRLIALMTELNSMGPPQAGASGPPPQVLEMETVGKQVGIFGTILNVMLVAILSLMVFKPGLG